MSELGLNLLVNNCKQRLAVRYRSEYCGDLRYQRSSFLRVVEFSVRATYYFALIQRISDKIPFCKEHPSDIKYYQCGVHVA